jgi:hypothetical protein
MAGDGDNLNARLKQASAQIEAQKQKRIQQATQDLLAFASNPQTAIMMKVLDKILMFLGPLLAPLQLAADQVAAEVFDEQIEAVRSSLEFVTSDGFSEMISLVSGLVSMIINGSSMLISFFNALGDLAGGPFADLVVALGDLFTNADWDGGNGLIQSILDFVDAVSDFVGQVAQNTADAVGGE